MDTTVFFDINFILSKGYERYKVVFTEEVSGLQGYKIIKNKVTAWFTLPLRHKRIQHNKNNNRTRARIFMRAFLCLKGYLINHFMSL